MDDFDNLLVMQATGCSLQVGLMLVRGGVESLL